MLLTQKSICFVGLDNYPVLNPEWGDHYFGGESVQQTLLAKAFHQAGYTVSMIVADLGQPDGEEIAGIRVIKAYSPRAGLPVIRFAHPRLTRLYAALGKAKADIYYQSCAGMLTGVVADFCRRHGREFVFRVAHDSDCIPGQQLIRFWRDKKIYEYGLRRADIIAAQGHKQVELLRTNYRLASETVNMVVDIPDCDENRERDIDILWVNNLRDFKRPELVPDVARALPESQVTMIGGAVPGNEDLYHRIIDTSRGIDNLDMLGAVPFDQIGDYFLRCKVFVNTSDWEGFPNSFLQAWSVGAPVVSFFDPDGIIAGRQLGCVPQDLPEMVACVQELLTDERRRNAISERAMAFVADNYAPEAVVKNYVQLIGNSERQ